MILIKAVQKISLETNVALILVTSLSVSVTYRHPNKWYLIAECISCYVFIVAMTAIRIKSRQNLKK